jgi:hypothetical protein
MQEIFNLLVLIMVEYRSKMYYLNQLCIYIAVNKDISINIDTY